MRKSFGVSDSLSQGAHALEVERVVAIEKGFSTVPHGRSLRMREGSASGSKSDLFEGAPDGGGNVRRNARFPFWGPTLLKNVDVSVKRHDGVGRIKSATPRIDTSVNIVRSDSDLIAHGFELRPFRLPSCGRLERDKHSRW
jgi:hypothetical protein